MKIIDISVALTPQTIVYPNDPLVEFAPLKIKNKKSSVTKISFGTHSGTHVDAPRHVFAKGKTIDQLPLESFYGPCRALDCTSSKVSVTVEDLQRHKIKKGERILIKTSNSRRGFKKFYSDYIFLSPEAAEYLARLPISLFGIDYLSVKQRGNPDNRAHTALLQKNIPIYETLDLSKVTAGRYIFVGFPLKYIGLDGASVRAVLIKP